MILQRRNLPKSRMMMDSGIEWEMSVISMIRADCGFVGETRCVLENSVGYQVCKWVPGGCLQWEPEILLCPDEHICQSGECKANTCEDECQVALNEIRCVIEGNVGYQVCVYDEQGCLGFGETIYLCPENQICRQGACLEE